MYKVKPFFKSCACLLSISLSLCWRTHRFIMRSSLLFRDPLELTNLSDCFGHPCIVFLSKRVVALRQICLLLFLFLYDVLMICGCGAFDMFYAHMQPANLCVILAGQLIHFLLVKEFGLLLRCCHLLMMD